MNTTAASNRKGNEIIGQVVPAGTDMVLATTLLFAWAALYVPTFMDLSRTIWVMDENGHGPIILSVSAWLLFRMRHQLLALDRDPAPLLGWSSLVFGLLLYAFGRAQGIVIFEVGSQIPVLIGVLLLFIGPRALRLAWFPLLFLMFMVPLPGPLVQTLTTPLKTAVSFSAEHILYQLGYPVARAGVILSVGQYQLLVADACAGLNSMFTLEALGLLYMNLMGYKNATRNTMLALLIIPISFVANIVRVMILILVTYYFGDEAGQGFIHGFAGMVLFISGLVLILAVDSVLGMFFRSDRRGSHDQQLPA